MFLQENEMLKISNAKILKVEFDINFNDFDTVIDSLLENEKEIYIIDYFPKAIKDFEKYNEIGEMDSSYSLDGIGRFRVNVFRQLESDAIAIRSITLDVPTLEELNHPSIVKELANKKRGLVLVTGPTGSGKSTTLAAMINSQPLTIYA